MRSRRTAQLILLAQAVLLGALGVAGLVTATATPDGVAEVAGFRLNVAHSAVLLVTAAASGLAALWTRVARAWATVQATGYTLAFLIGTAVSAGPPPDTWLALNAADHFLHLGLALTGGVLAAALLVSPVVIPIAQEEAPERRPTPRQEESAQTRDMIQAEVAVAEGHATAEQQRRVEDDAQRRADAEHRRAWEQFQR